MTEISAVVTHESERERVNRELLELLGELRVALPGVQVLFAFLLAVPFQARFADATGFQRGVYFATLTLSALASVLLIAPSALHCLNFRMADKRRVVFVSNALTIWGLLVLAVAMTGVMLLIPDVLFGTAVGISVAAASAGVFAFFWVAAANNDVRRDMNVRVAINGCGRVGRCFLRSAYEHQSPVEIVAVNDVADSRTLAALLRHDSVYGRFASPVECDDKSLTIDGSRIAVFSEAEPAALPWRDLEVDLVIESTGRFRTRAGAQRHLDAGARKVVITAPAKGDEPVDANVVLGVNFDEVYDPERHHIVTNASCTTNCLAPVAKVLHDTIGIRHGLMTTVHAYTADQNLLDGPHKDLRRARAAGINMVPTSTGAAKALGLVIPELQGRLHGYAVRVPLSTGSLVDLTVESERPTTAEEVNAAFANRADSGELEGILAYSEEPLVATDVIGSDYSAVFDAPLTAVIDGTQVKVVAWYDNEWGYSTRLVELAERVFGPVPAVT